MTNPFAQFAEYLLLGTLFIIPVAVLIIIQFPSDWITVAASLKQDFQPLISVFAPLLLISVLSVLILCGYGLTLLRIRSLARRDAEILHEELSYHREWFEKFLNDQAPKYEKTLKEMDSIIIFWDPVLAIVQILKKHGVKKLCKEYSKWKVDYRTYKASLRKKSISMSRQVSNVHGIMLSFYCLMYIVVKIPTRAS